MGSVAVYLELSGKLHGHHLVFHISLLLRYLPDVDRVKPTAPIIIDDMDENEVEALIAHW